MEHIFGPNLHVEVSRVLGTAVVLALLKPVPLLLGADMHKKKFIPFLIIRSSFVTLHIFRFAREFDKVKKGPFSICFQHICGIVLVDWV